MTAATWITMIGILLFVWGGFTVALATAIRGEGRKRREHRERRPEGGGGTPR